MEKVLVREECLVDCCINLVFRSHVRLVISHPSDDIWISIFIHFLVHLWLGFSHVSY